MEDLFHRTRMLLGDEGMARLRDKTVAIAGCGGVGGATALTLCRLGVGGFVLADPGIYDEPDFNRQWAGSHETLGQNKARVHERMLQAINPAVRLTVFDEGVTEDNLDAFLEPADLLVDCLDISVPLSLRSRVYRQAMARGLYAFSAPIFGFGTLVLCAEPGGMGMGELIEGFVEVASTRSELPGGFPRFFFQPHLEPIEREIHKHKVPTSALAVVLATGIVCSEVALVFLRDQYPDTRGPVCLPRVFAVDPIRQNYRVVLASELFVDDPPDRKERVRALERAGNDPVALPRDQVAADYLTDSWGDRTDPPPVPHIAAPDLDDLLVQTYGYPNVAAVFRGRFAESVLAPLLVAPGQAVVGNGLFPTTRYHIAACGGPVVDLRRGDDTADLDLDRLERHLERGIGAVWIELCCDAAGGRPVTLENLVAVHDLASSKGVPVVLDATRAHENARQLLARDPTLLGGSVNDLVLALCNASDATATSLTKDHLTPVGGFVGLRSPTLHERLLERTSLMIGDGLDPERRRVIARGIAWTRDHPDLLDRRKQRLEALATRLERLGAPLVGALGHGVFVDASAVLPEHGRPGLALCHALYLEAGVRAAPSMANPGWVRLAVALGDSGSDDELVAGFRSVLARSDVGDLVRTGGPGGILGTFVGRYEVA